MITWDNIRDSSLDILGTEVWERPREYITETRAEHHDELRNVATDQQACEKKKKKRVRARPKTKNVTKL